MSIADSIGGYTFVWLQGDITPAMPHLEDISRKYVPGIAVRQGPTKGKKTELQGLSIGYPDSAVDALIGSYTQLMGTLQTIVLRDMTYTNFYIWEVYPTNRKLVYSQLGWTWNLYTTWQVQYGGLSS